MNAQEISVKEFEYRGYQCYKVFPLSGFWPKGGMHKDEVRKLLEEMGYQITSDEPYILNANEFFPELNPLESVQAFVFFKTESEQCGECRGSGSVMLDAGYEVSCMNCNGRGYV